MVETRFRGAHTPQHASTGHSAQERDSGVPVRRVRFSPEIHGVRGLALTMVVAFHLFGHGRVSGGVDVFLVISAYLITGSLDRAMHRGSFKLLHRYARTFIRLTPAALLTIVSTVAAGLFILPRSAWPSLLEQASAAAMFQENIFLATEGMSYGAAGEGASPFQHFWSLSVQAQFFLLWPLAALLLLLALSGTGRRWRSSMFAALALAMTVASFFYALVQVSVDQPVAYYSLGARLWEFGLGALAYFWGLRVKKYAASGAWAGWLGIALILSSGFLINGRDLFPGPWTLWPVVGTLLVLFASDSGGATRAGLTRALELAPIKKLADLGYVLYLWHWPILVLYLQYRAYPNVGWRGATGVLVASLVLADLTNRVVACPTVRLGNRLQARPRGSLVLVVGLLLAITLVGGLTHIGADVERGRQQREVQSILEGGISQPGAAILLDPSLGDDLVDGDIVPAPDVAVEDRPAVDALDCISRIKEWNLKVCEDMPGPTAVEAAGTPNRLVLVGGSHDLHYFEGLRTLADAQGWELFVVSKSGCRLSAPDEEHTLSEQCTAWNERVVERIVSLEPDAVVSLSTVTDSEGVERVFQGQKDAWQQLGDAGIPVIGMRDNPRFQWGIPACLQLEADPSDCGIPRNEIYAEDFEALFTDAPSNLIPIDTSGWFCDQDFCPPVIGNVVLYRDKGHFTATYSRTLAPLILESLEENAPFLFE